jgi:hypothetical protein
VTGQGDPLAWYQSRSPIFNPARSCTNSVMRNNSHLPCCSLNMQVVVHDSHAGGGMLDHSIRGSSTHSILPEFYSWIGQGSSSIF